MSTTTPLILALPRLRKRAYQTHYQACWNRGQPFIVIWGMPSGWWRIEWSDRTLNHDRWTVEFVEPGFLDNLITDIIAHGSRRAVMWRFGNDTSGNGEGLREQDAITLAEALVARFADPTSYVSLTSNRLGLTYDDPVWPRKLRFDWFSEQAIPMGDGS